MNKSIPYCLVLLISFINSRCSPGYESQNSGDAHQNTADIIFVGENIVTMESYDVEAVAVIGDRIVAVGDQEDILRMQDEKTRFVELGAKALLPGFIDAHGHFGAVAIYAALLDLSSPPVGNMEDIDDIINAIRGWISSNNIPIDR